MKLHHHFLTKLKRALIANSLKSANRINYLPTYLSLNVVYTYYSLYCYYLMHILHTSEHICVFFPSVSVTFFFKVWRCVSFMLWGFYLRDFCYKSSRRLNNFKKLYLVWSYLITALIFSSMTRFNKIFLFSKEYFHE